ncbi:MAG: hypothetical protein FWH28_03485 [Clostridiales bacterium]|nr:hypothetical protein [Clostridiales bacterium]
MASMNIETQAISRHQLYFHHDVPYTSHNSSMCTEMEVAKDFLPELIGLAQRHLTDASAKGADPGLCVACVEDIGNIAALISFGLRAKNSLLRKDEAYQLAKEEHIHLSEHGGTGQGVIGALAGAALRLYGFDGRMRGNRDAGEDNTVMKASELLEKTGYASIQAIDGAEVARDALVTLTEGRVKAVRMNWRSTIIVIPALHGAALVTLDRQSLKMY